MPACDAFMPRDIRANAEYDGLLVALVEELQRYRALGPQHGTR